MIILFMLIGLYSFALVYVLYISITDYIKEKVVKIKRYIEKRKIAR